MPFDPTKPANNSDLSSQEIRNQLNGLKALIDAVLAGPPETPAAASVHAVGNNVELSFTIPQGETGGVTSSDVTNAIANEITGTARNPNSE